MILHLSDWKRYPSAIVDTDTKNRSFVELADKYRAMGIKNYFFHLALLQPELKGIDPFDKTLGIEIQTKILAECVNNPWYYFREILRLPAAGGMPTPLRGNRGNIGTYWCYFNHIDVALVQPRQTGKSVGADGANGYVINVAGRRATFQLITKDHDLRVKNVQRLKDIRDLLPAYINPFDKKIDSNNQLGYTANIYENKMTTGVAQMVEAAALNLGRGSTSESNQVDEGPFCSLIHITMDPFLSSGNAARANAAANGAFYGNIFTTTAGKLDTKEGAYMYNMFTGGMDLDERILFDAGSTPAAQKMVNVGSKGEKPMVYICLSHIQLGYSNEWLYANMANSNAKGDSADRDYFNRWTTGSLRSPLTTKTLETIRESLKNSEHVEITPRGYCVQWYIPEKDIEQRLSSGHFVLGNDTSEGVGKDACTMYLTDSYTLETIATIALSETNIYSFIDWFGELMLKYPKIIAIPERKSQGVTLIDSLIVKLISNNINPFSRIYNTVIEDGLHLSDPEEFGFLSREPITWPSWVADRYKTRFGYGTASGGRHKRDNLYLETLTRAAKLTATKMYDGVLIREIAALVEKNGRIDHPTKGHDDMVIAYLLSMWFILHSKNLDYYGITNPAGGAVPYDEVKTDENKTPVTLLRDREQERIREAIRTKLHLIEEEEDEFNIQIHVAQIRVLSRRLNEQTIENNTIADLIRNAREQRNEYITGLSD